METITTVEQLLEAYGNDTLKEKLVRIIAANLSEADLRAANLRNANLRAADLYNANLYAADLYTADLYNANLRNANLRAADLYNADLSAANLSAADLYNANLRNANLRAANLINTQIYSGFGLSVSSRHDSLYGGVVIEDGKLALRFWAGCQKGVTVAELRESVKETHNDNIHAEQYELSIQYISALFASDMKHGALDYLLTWDEDHKKVGAA